MTEHGPRAHRPQTALVSAGRSLGARLLVLPVTAACSLLNAHLQIVLFGGPIFAYIALLGTVSQLLPFADLGLGAGIINRVSLGPGDPRTRAYVVQSVRLAISSAAGVAVVGSAVAAAVVVRLSNQPRGLLAGTVAVVLVFAASVPLGLGQRILVGLKLNQVVVAASAIPAVVALGWTLLTSGLHLAPVAAILGLPVGTLLSAAGTFVIASRRLGLGFRESWRVKAERRRDILSEASSYLIVMIFSALMLPASRFVVAGYGGVGAAADYALVLQMYLPAVSLMLAASVALWPHFAEERGGASGPSSLTTALLAFGGIAGLGGICIVTCGPLFGAIVSARRLSPSFAEYAFAGVLLVAQSLQYVLGIFLTDKRGLRFQAILSVPSGVVSLLATVLLARLQVAGCGFLGTAIGVLGVQVFGQSIYIRMRSRLAARDSRAASPVAL